MSSSVIANFKCTKFIRTILLQTLEEIIIKRI